MAKSPRLAKLRIQIELMMNADVANNLAIYAETCDPAPPENGQRAEFLIKTILKKTV